MKLKVKKKDILKALRKAYRESIGHIPNKIHKNKKKYNRKPNFILILD